MIEYLILAIVLFVVITAVGYVAVKSVDERREEKS